MDRGLKFRIKVVDGLYFPYSENKDADQLLGHYKADLCLCFRISKNAGFLMTRLILFNQQITKVRVCKCVNIIVINNKELF